jgi:hypothetical protein
VIRSKHEQTHYSLQCPRLHQHFAGTANTHCAKGRSLPKESPSHTAGRGRDKLKDPPRGGSSQDNKPMSALLCRMLADPITLETM